MAFTTRFVLFSLVVTMIGALVFSIVVVPRARMGERTSSLVLSATRIAMYAGILVVPVAGIQLYLQADGLRFPGDPILPMLLPILTETIWGQAWVVQVIAAVVAALSLVLWRMEKVSGIAIGLSLLSVLVLSVTLSLSGHAVAGDGNRALSVAADAIHVVGAGAWVGTLAIIAALVLTRKSVDAVAPDELAEEKLRVVQAFSPFALLCAAAVTLSGVISALPKFPSLGLVFSSDYGMALLFKLAAVALVLLFGFLNWRRNTALILEDGGRAIKGGVWRELLATILVLLMTSALVVTPPPSDQ